MANVIVRREWCYEAAVAMAPFSSGAMIEQFSGDVEGADEISRTTNRTHKGATQRTVIVVRATKTKKSTKQKLKNNGKQKDN